MRPCYAWLVCGLLALCGCTAPSMRAQSPEEYSEILESKTKLVGDVARPFGHTYVKVESAALATGLDGTGEDPAPSPLRAALLHELQTIGVQHPNQLLASPSTSLVVVRGYLPPGVRKGDRFDLEVQVPSHSETARRTSLDGTPATSRLARSVRASFSWMRWGRQERILGNWPAVWPPISLRHTSTH